MQLVGRLPVIKGRKAKESEIPSSVYTSSENTAFCPLYIRIVVIRVGHREFENLISRSGNLGTVALLPYASWRGACLNTRTIEH
jgi:hypothetical protein